MLTVTRMLLITDKMSLLSKPVDENDLAKIGVYTLTFFWKGLA